MIKFRNDAIIAYRDVLAYIRKVDPDFKNPKIKRVFDYVERRLNTYLNPEVQTEDIIDIE